MKLTGIVCAFCIVIALALLSRPLAAAQAAGKDTSTVSAAKSVELAAAPNEPVAPQDKPAKSNKNDNKDSNPDDGNAGGGNDNRTPPGPPPGPPPGGNTGN